MDEVPSVILWHELPVGSHYDWLLGYPPAHAPASGRLWTARLELPPEAWLAAGSFMARRVEDHRAFYLDYEGPVSGDRGHVRRVESARATYLSWSPDAFVVELHGSAFEGRLAVRHTDGAWWRCEVGAAAT